MELHSGMLYRRIQWDRVWFVMVQEASSFIYSKSKSPGTGALPKGASFIY
jgi:hypothetical protein